MSIRSSSNGVRDVPRTPRPVWMGPRIGFPTRALVVALLAGVACDGACSACSTEDTLGELIETEGAVSRDYNEKRNDWQAATVGAAFALGDGVRTGVDAQAAVELRGGGGIRLVPETIVRFLAAPPGNDAAGAVSVEAGEVDLEAGANNSVSVVGTFGDAVLTAGSRMRVQADAHQLGLEVLIGSARIQQGQQEPIELGEGQTLVFDVELGEASVERDTEDAGSPPDAGPEDAGLVASEWVGIKFRGRVERQTEDGGWERVSSAEERLRSGTVIRARRRARLTASNDRGTVVLIGPAQGVVGAGADLAALQNGRAQLDSQEGEVTLAVPGGRVVARGPGSRADVRLIGEDASVRWVRGRGELRSPKDRFLLLAGDRGRLLEDGTVDAAGRPPASAHMAVIAGAGGTIHDPSTPVHVRVQFGSLCSGEGVVEVARGGSFRRPAMRSFGTGSANISVPSGSHRYRLRCITDGTPNDAAAATGSFVVRRDRGRQRLPRRPPRNRIDADGRRYTLLYQNLLPIVSARWADAPNASRYRLVFQPSSGTERRIEASKPAATLESGMVPEGTHRLWFEAVDGSPPRSPVTTVAVRFDNAASAAFLKDPPPGRPISGSVPVSGVAVRGSEVSVGGVKLPLDQQFRFSGTVTVPESLQALTIKIVHPRSGVHYYLRRAAGK